MSQKKSNPTQHTYTLPDNVVLKGSKARIQQLTKKLLPETRHRSRWDKEID